MDTNVFHQVSGSSPRLLAVEWATSVWRRPGDAGFPSSFADASELLHEGAAMLASLCRGMRLAGAEVRAAATKHLPDWFAAQVSQWAALRTHRPPENERELTELWRDAASDCDAVCVVAPEIDMRLPRLVSGLAERGTPVINCTGDFLLSASDKWKTTEALQAAGIPHPPTMRLDLLDPAWLEAVQRQWGNRSWVCKPRDGAGCVDIRFIDSACTDAVIDRFHKVCAGNPARWLIQPWIPGIPASCSGMVISREGHCCWFPALEQKLSISPAGMAYTGGRTLSLPAEATGKLTDLLNRTLQALGATPLGWIGIDLVYRTETRQWLVIEVNPRVTSSLVGWTDVAPQLVADLWQRLLHGDRLSPQSLPERMLSPAVKIDFTVS